MRPRALLLTPSSGRGGGIERYVETLEWAFANQGIDYSRIDLGAPGPVGHARMLIEARSRLRANAVPTRIILAHRALLPLSSLLTSEPSACGISLLCHGAELWGPQLRIRRIIENLIVCKPEVRLVAVSNFTSGTIFRYSKAAVLPPTLSPRWFNMLVSASTGDHPRDPGVRLLTTFRLEDWRDKGLPQLLAAIADLGRPDVHLLICGSGQAPIDLKRLVSRYPFSVVRTGLSDDDLAEQFAAADLFVLATRTSTGRRASGEGFGLALLEAQLAGTAVVAPAFGGSGEAFVDHITGLAPKDETTDALKGALNDILKDPMRLASMGIRAAEWSRERFSPERYAREAVMQLL